MADQQLVYGIASTDTPDDQGGVWEGHRYDADVVDATALKEAAAEWAQWGNIREMHDPRAVGTAVYTEVRDGALVIGVKVHDADVWRKVKAKIYKGFSIGGKVLKAILEKLPDGRTVRRILKFKLFEISLVDRPANPAARFTLLKSLKGDAMDDTIQLDGVLLAKAADPSKVVSLIQQLRNEAELAGNIDGAQLFTQAISLVLQANGDADAAALDSPAGEETAETEAPVEGEVEAMAKSKRLRMGKRLQSIEQTAKTLLQLAADAGSQTAQFALQAYAGEAMTAKTIATEITKTLTPIVETVAQQGAALSSLLSAPARTSPALNTQAVRKSLNGGTQPVTENATREMAKSVITTLEHQARTQPAQRATLEARIATIKAEFGL